MLASNIKIQIGNRDILRDVSFVLGDNDKVGLVGINGAGKSTLLKVLAGELKADSGKFDLEGATIGYLKQEIPFSYNNLSVIEYLKKALKIDVMEQRMRELENDLTDQNMEEYSNLLNAFLAIDGYSFDDNLKTVLSGLNFNTDINNPIGTLSGGEKIKVLLAELLLKNTDILLLDEPTNNLDLEAIEWLEKRLKASAKKMIIISHDEQFLNNIVNKIYELTNGVIREYNLSYNDYLAQKELEYLNLKEAYERSLEKKDKLKQQIQKSREWANKGINKKAHNDNDKLANNYAKERTNTSNISKLTRELENLDIPDFEEKKPINVFFNLDDAKGNKDIALEHLVCGYENFQTCEINLFIPYGTRLNIYGGNGSGKTTLVKTILGLLDPITGQVKIGANAKIGYISQDTLTAQTEDSIYVYLTKAGTDIDKSKVFTLLDKFNIAYDDRDKAYALLSPGERTRVNLAKLALDNINVLILDEVTNHLDKEALDLIYELVSTYSGTIISISHNRKYNDILNSDMDLDMRTGQVIPKKVLKR